MHDASSRSERMRRSPARLRSRRPRSSGGTRPAASSSESVDWPRAIAILALASLLGLVLGVVSDAFDWPVLLSDAIALATAGVLAAVMLSHALRSDRQR